MASKASAPDVKVPNASPCSPPSRLAQNKSATGLSARNSVAACGGEVRFANRTPKGFRAEVRLKAA